MVWCINYLLISIRTQTMMGSQVGLQLQTCRFCKHLLLPLVHWVKSLIKIELVVESNAGYLFYCEKVVHGESMVAHIFPALLHFMLTSHLRSEIPSDLRCEGDLGFWFDKPSILHVVLKWSTTLIKIFRKTNTHFCQQG